MEETIHRDSYQMAEDYVDEDLREFISVEKYKLLESEANSITICVKNNIHIGVKIVEGISQCAECGSQVNTIKRVK